MSFRAIVAKEKNKVIVWAVAPLFLLSFDFVLIITTIFLNIKLFYFEYQNIIVVDNFHFGSFGGVCKRLNHI